MLTLIFYSLIKTIVAAIACMIVGGALKGFLNSVVTTYKFSFDKTMSAVVRKEAKLNSFGLIFQLAILAVIGYAFYRFYPKGIFFVIAFLMLLSAFTIKDIYKKLSGFLMLAAIVIIFVSFYIEKSI